MGKDMPSSKTSVKDSKIHGRGLFARCAIKQGECIGVIRGEKTTQNGDHVLWLTEKHGIRINCELRFINHYKTANACIYDSLEVIALKDIQPGEEITYNYEQE